MTFLRLYTRKDWVVVTIAFFMTLYTLPLITNFAYAQDLITKERLMSRSNTGVTLYDRHGSVFYKFYETKYYSNIPLSNISDYAKLAILSAEDKDFYHHPGFSIKALVGSAIADVKHQAFIYGGSTITQQLVKNSLLDTDKTIARKYRELVLAQEIEKRFSKDQILEMYLNSVYFGEGSFGIDDAAKTYFTVSAKDLDLAQSALLAGLLSAPSRLSPLSGDKDQAIQNQQFILAKMYENNQISLNQLHQAQNEQLIFKAKSHPISPTATHFALMVRQQLIDRYGEKELAQSGLHVFTTLDLNLQKYAQTTVKQQVNKLASNHVSNAATIVTDPRTGQVLALVGSVNWDNPKFGKVNMTTTPRQPGSSFKPIVYASAFEKGVITPSTILLDKPTTFPGNYTPQNYDHNFRGPVLARRALANSLNVPSVQMLNKLGVQQALDTAASLGITTLNDPSRFGLSLVLGTGEVSLLEMTNAYAAFANGGRVNEPALIISVDDKFGQTIYQNTVQPKQILNPTTSFQISSILADPIARREEFGDLLDTPQKAAVKTGTSEGYKDSWTIGYTPNLVVGVWVGNNDGSPMSQIAGSIGAAPIWKQQIQQFEQNRVALFLPPEGMIKLSVCRFNGLPTTEATSSAVAEYFASGTQPKARCAIPKPSPTPQPIN